MRIAGIDTIGELRALEPAWTALFAAGAGAHLMTSWPCIFAAASALRRDRDWRVYTAWSDSTLRAGLFGVRSTRRIGRLEIPVVEVGTEFAGDVLTDARDRDAALSALLSEVLAREDVPMLDFGMLTQEGARAVRTSAHRAGLRCTWGPAGYGYAWDAPADHDQMYRSLGGRRRNSLRRNARLFAETFALEMKVTSSGDLAEDLSLFDDFVRLEASGWKGREGTAIRDRPGNAEYYRTIVEEASRHGMMRWSSLLADGRVVAMHMVLQTGRALWVPKTAFDEGFARHSPGAELVHRLHLACVDDPGIETVNWIAAPTWLDSWRPRRVPFTHLRVFSDSPAGRTLYWASRLQRALRRHLTARGQEEADRETRYL